VPHQPDAVFSKPDVEIRTTTLAALTEALWEARTPSNLRELDAQSPLIRERVRRNKSSSPASIFKAIQPTQEGG
jgi:hypothetical protein